MRKRIRLRRRCPFTTHLCASTAAVSRQASPLDTLIQALVGAGSARPAATSRAATSGPARPRSVAARARHSATRSAGPGPTTANTGAASGSGHSTAGNTSTSTAGLHALTRAAADLSASTSARPRASSASTCPRRIHGGAASACSARVGGGVGATTQREPHETQHRQLARFSRGHESANLSWRFGSFDISGVIGGRGPG
jgi:hypothetical protein